MMEPFFHSSAFQRSFPAEFLLWRGWVPVNFQMVDWFGCTEGMSRHGLRCIHQEEEICQGQVACDRLSVGVLADRCKEDVACAHRRERDGIW